MVNKDHVTGDTNITTSDMMASTRKYRTRKVGIRNPKPPTVSLSIRFSHAEMALFDKILDRRNAVSENHCQLTKSRVILTQILNWIIANQDNDEPFPPHPSQMMQKHDI
jgi:hypothetical protein